LILVGLLLAVALPLIASAEHQRDTTPARQALGGVSSIMRGRAPTRFDTSTRKPTSSSRGNLTPQVLGCGNATATINYGQTINGTLAPGDCTNPIDGTLYDAYTFNGVAGQQIVIDMTSTDFDDYLYLMRPGETNISPDPNTTLQDDDGGGGTNARITLTLPSTGTYTILADSYGNGITPGGTGHYALTVTQVCTYALTSAGRTVTSAGGTFNDAYTTQAGCAAPTLTSNTTAFITAGSATTPDASGNGTFSYTVAANTGAARAGTLTVADQTFTVQQAVFSPGTLQLNSSAYSVSEGAGSVSINVTRTGGTDGAVSVNYSTADVTATAGADYTAASGTLNFNDGDTQKSISIPITNDAEVEGDETFTITLSNASVATLGSPSNATVTINDNDTCSYAINPTSQTSPSPAAGDAGSVSVTAPLGCHWTASTPPSSSWLTLTINGAPSGSGNGNGTVGYTVAPNPNSVARTATLTIAGQSFNVTQAAAPSVLQFSGSAYAVGEDGSSVVLTVTRTGATGGVVSVNYATSNGTATGGADYATQTGTLNFADGETSKTITISILEDQIVEGDETFMVTLSNPTGGATLGSPATATITIGDNDTCSYTLPNANRAVSSSVGTFSDAYKTLVGCSAPTVKSNTGFITAGAASAPDANGNGTFAYRVAANAGAQRAGTLTVADQTFTVTQAFATYQISGHIADSGNNNLPGLSGVTVTLSTVTSGGSTNVSTTTDAQGHYSFTNLAAGGDYIVTPTKANYSFAPASISFNPLLGDQTANFVGTLGSFTLGGRVTIGTTGLGNVTITLSGDVSGVATTDTQGNYSFSVAAGGNYTVTPSLTHYTFNPTIRTFNSLTTDATAADFAATFNTHAISGRITDGANKPLNGVNVSLTGAQTSATTTNANGDYSFTNLPEGGTYNVTPSLANYTFTPVQQTINIDGDRPNIDFVGTVVPTVLQFGQGQYQIAEDGGRVAVTITRGGDPSAAVSVDVRTVDNPAAVPCGDTTTLPNVAFARCDYATTVETLVFAANETQKTVSVPIIDDAYAEPTESFQLSLSNPNGGATIGAQGTTSVAITDNDLAGEANPINSTDFFVRMQYLDFLSREPEAGQPWSGVLNNCSAGDTSCDRISVSANFFRSQEFQLKGLFVYRFYKLAFNRQPLYAEIVADMRAVTGTTTAEVQAKKGTFAAAFTQRQEFKNLYDSLTNQQFVDTLINRYSIQSVTTPDPATPDGTTKVTLTRTDLVNRLNAATLTRAQVVRAIADSDQVGQAEFNPAFVAMQYFGYLRRDPEAQGYADWLRTINANPADFRSMVNGFMNSQEYRARFGQP
jgi:hypothetical protein